MMMLSTRSRTAPRVSPVSIAMTMGVTAGRHLNTNVIQVIKQAPEGAIIRVHVVPGSKAFAVAGEDPWTGEIKIKVKGKATEGKANQELVTELGKRLSAKVKIISGHRSRHKTLLVETDADTIKRLVT